MNLLSVLLVGGFSASGNTLISQYGVPLIGICMFIAIASGIFKNWDDITDQSGGGKRRDGLINILYMVGYAMLACALFAIISTMVSGISFTI